MPVGPPPFRLPAALTNSDDGATIIALNDYFGHPFGTGTHNTGSAFDLWDSTGTRHTDTNRFTPTTSSHSLTSINVQPSAARTILIDRVQQLADLLTGIGPDQDLVDVRHPIDDDWPASRAYRALVGIKHIKRTTAAKLLARKRPLLLPVHDRYVATATGCLGEHWEPLRVALRADDNALPCLSG